MICKLRFHLPNVCINRADNDWYDRQLDYRFR
jgi:hypothetical protein